MPDQILWAHSLHTGRLRQSEPTTSQGGKVGATYKDGALEVKGLLMSANLTYLKQTDTLLGPGFFGNVEYKRLK